MEQNSVYLVLRTKNVRSNPYAYLDRPPGTVLPTSDLIVECSFVNDLGVVIPDCTFEPVAIPDCPLTSRKYEEAAVVMYANDFAKQTNMQLKEMEPLMQEWGMFKNGKQFKVYLCSFHG